MVNFEPKTSKKFDNYMSPKHAWEDIMHLIPRNKVIWEAFYGDGKSGQYLRELGFEVIHEPIDFFTTNNAQIVVSNPPYSKAKEVLTRLRFLEKPFILIMPTSKICTQYIRTIFKDSTDKLQIIIPPKRIHFVRIVNGQVDNSRCNKCNFECLYYCWKINLPDDITWLNK
jgi:hypothetical protein